MHSGAKQAEDKDGNSQNEETANLTAAFDLPTSYEGSWLLWHGFKSSLAAVAMREYGEGSFAGYGSGLLV